jgi:hypothetical protein
MSIPFNKLKDKRPDFRFPNRALYPSEKPAYFYDGRLRGDMADFFAQSLEPYWPDEEFDDVPF